MNSPKINSSPSFKNLQMKKKQSPIAIKEKLRKEYKDRVQNSHDILINKYRGCVDETQVLTTLTSICKDTFNISDFYDLDEEDTVLLEKIKHELIEEEFQRCLEEYEKSHLNYLNESASEEENVICPVCQKTNLKHEVGIIWCPFCDIKIQTQKNLIQFKKTILESIEKHSANCDQYAQFTSIKEENDVHIYLICTYCTCMQFLV